MLSLSVNLDTLVQLVVGVGSAVLALLLMMIKIPQTAYSVRLTIAKHGLVVCLLLCSFMMFYTMSQYGKSYIWDWELLTMLMIYIVVHFSTVMVSYSMIALLKTLTFLL